MDVRCFNFYHGVMSAIAVIYQEIVVTSLVRSHQASMTKRSSCGFLSFDIPLKDIKQLKHKTHGDQLSCVRRRELIYLSASVHLHFKAARWGHDICLMKCLLLRLFIGIYAFMYTCVLKNTAPRSSYCLCKAFFHWSTSRCCNADCNAF